MTQRNEQPRGLMRIAAASVIALAGCNSPMPPDNSNALNLAPSPEKSGEAHGAKEAIATLALPPQKPLTPNPEYAKFPRYVGTLGGKQIEMKLGAKTDDPSGVHGEYHVVGSPAVTLVAGDRDADTLEIEESSDGTHITGNWVGKFAPDGSVSGERMDPDDSNSQPFDLRPAVAGAGLPAMPAAQSAPSAPVRSAAPSLEPAPPRNAVGGTSNVIIGE